MRGLGADEEYWSGLGKGVVKVQQCNGCGQWHVPPVWRCGECSSWELHWQTVEPKGNIFAWTRTWHQFGAPRELGLPILVALVELEGAGRRRLMGTMADPSAEVRIGQPVVGEVIQTTMEGETIHAIRWKPIGGASAASTGAGGQSS